MDLISYAPCIIVLCAVPIWYVLHRRKWTALHNLSRQLYVSDQHREKLESDLMHWIQRAAETEQQLRECIEEKRSASAEAARVLDDVLIVLGSDMGLYTDLGALRRAGMDIQRLVNCSSVAFEEEMNQARLRGNVPRNVHFALHGSRQGIEFTDGRVKPEWLAEQMTGVHCALVASCNSLAIGHAMRGIAEHVVVMAEEIRHEHAAIFAEAFWGEISRGAGASAAFDHARSRSPADVAEMVRLY